MKENSKRILIYLGIVFLITYVVEIFVIAPLAGNSDMYIAMLAQLMLSIVMFFPALSVVLTRIITKEGFQKDDVYLIPHFKGNLKYYLLAWFGIEALILVGAVLYFFIFPECFDPEMGYLKATLTAQGQTEVTTVDLRNYVLLQFVVGILAPPFLNFINCFGEEWGWRGYLLPKLMERFSVVPALLISGMIWGLWHAPIIALGHNYGTGYPGYPYVGILAMCIFCIVTGIILSYVTIKTKSCIPAVVGHATINGFASIGILFTSVEHPYNVFLGPLPVGLVGGVGLIVLAVILLWKLYKEEKLTSQ